MGPKIRRVALATSIVSLLCGAALADASFSRGDANADGRLDVTDAVFMLRHLFQGEPPRADCEDALDADDDGGLNVTDVIHALHFLFLAGPAIPQPAFPDCGTDPTPDALDCRRFAPCAEPSRTPLFPDPALEVTGGLEDMAAGDLDGDGDLDVACALGSRPGAAIFLNQGRGRFSPEATFTFELGDPSASGTSIAAGDTDGDGDDDLALAVHSSVSAGGRVAIVRSSEGDLGLAEEHVVGPLPGPLAFADLDGDGDLDLLVADRNTAALFVLLGRGDGSFAAPERHDARASRHIATGDANGDGAADVVLGDGESESLLVLPGRGDGTFGDAVLRPIGAPVGPAAFADLDRDGDVDLAVSDRFGITVFSGGGGGALDEQSSYRFDPLRRSFSPPEALALRDLDGDGWLDAVTAAGELLSVILNRGDGRLGPTTYHRGGAAPVSLALEDVDGDGHQDILVASRGTGTVSARLGRGDGTFAGEDVRTGDEPITVAVGDLDGDGRPDLAVATRDDEQGPHHATVLLNRGDGGFERAGTFPGGGGSQSLVMEDLDRDGDLDLAVGGPTVGVFLNDGGASFATGSPLRVRADLLAAADLDQDGDLDLATVTRPDFRWSVLRVHRNGGDGTFTADDPVIPIQFPGFAVSLAVADLDGDGLPEVAVVADGAAKGELTVFPNTGDGNLGIPFPLDAGGQVESAAAADLDGDGDVDIAATVAAAVQDVSGLRWSARLIALLNDGGTFRSLSVAAREALGKSTFGRVTTADVDGDGGRDLVVVNRRRSSLGVFLNRGGEVFEREGSYHVCSPEAAALGDLDGDGDADLVVPSSGCGSVSLLLNRRR